MLSRKKVVMVIILICTLLFFSSILQVLGHIGSDVNSSWATVTPTIDGNLSTGEWDDATSVDFTMQMRTRTDGSLNKVLHGKFYVKNNWITLYILIQIFNDDYAAQDFANRWEGICILFDDNHNGVIETGENGEGVTTWSGSPFYSKNDLYFTNIGFWDADLNAGKTNDGSLAWSHTNPTQGAIGNWTFEMAIPLVGSDGDDYDFSIDKLPKIVGFKIWFQEPYRGTDGVFPDDTNENVNINEITNGATFGNLIIHPLYKLTIQTTPGGTTNPPPGEYEHPYGTVVSITAIPSSGFAFDHWELNGTNVGTATTYTLTMNANYVLKAFFKAIPAMPVGGYSFSITSKPVIPLQFALYTTTITLFGFVMSVTRRKRK